MAVNYVKFQRGSQAAYDLLVKNSRIDDNTLYFIYPEDNSTVGKLYLGTRLISGGDIVLATATLAELADVLVNSTKANSFLVQNADGKWDNMSLTDVAALIKENMGEIAAPANVFQATRTADDASDEAAIAKAVQAAGKTTDDLNAGDSAIVKTLIHGDKYQHTAYVYDGSAWAAMDGNYNAENVYFDENILITTAVGNVTLTNGQGSIPAAGKNIKQVFEALWAKEDLSLTINNPTISLSVSSNATGEVGTTFTRPTATLKVTSTGNYEYGSKNSAGTVYTKDNGTGVTFSELKVGCGQTVASLTSTNSTTKSGTYNANETVTYTAGASDIASNVFGDTVATYYFCGSGTHGTTDRKPVTNMGNFIDSTGKSTSVYADGTKQIAGTTLKKENSNKASWTATGYRSSFYYIGTDHTSALDSDFIRNSTSRNSNTTNFAIDTTTPGGNSFSGVVIPANTTRVMFAFPGKYENASIAVVNVDGMNLPEDGFVKSYVRVKGANDFVSPAAVNETSEAKTENKDGYIYTVFTKVNPNGMAATGFTVTISKT